MCFNRVELLATDLVDTVPEISIMSVRLFRL